MMYGRILVALNHAFDTHEHFGYQHTSTLDDHVRGIDFAFQHSYMGLGLPAGEPVGFDKILKSASRFIGSDKFEALRSSLLDLYSIDIYPLDPASLQAVDAKMRDAHGDKDFIIRVLKERDGIDGVVLDVPADCWKGWDHPLFKMTMRCDDTIFPFVQNRPGAFKANPEGTGQVQSFASSRGLELGSLDAFDDAMEQWLDHLRPRACAVKIGAAYQRSIDFELEENDDGRIGAIYKQIVAGTGKFSGTDVKRWGNYIVSHLAGYAQVEGLPVQVHTGLASIVGTNPVSLAPLLSAWPGVTFDLFHGGYPYHHEITGVLGRFHNAHVDLCWMPILSRDATKHLLKECIAMGVSDRVLAFGGDCVCVEGSHGALLGTKEILASVLADLVSTRNLAFDDALSLGLSMLHDNAARVYGKRT